MGVLPLGSLPAPDRRPKRSLHFAAGEALLVCGADNGAIYVWDTAARLLVDDYQQRHKVLIRLCPVIALNPGLPLGEPPAPSEALEALRPSFWAGEF